MDLARVHLFDAGTGDAIVHGLTGEIETPSRQQADDLSA